MRTIAMLPPEAAYLLKGRLEAEGISAFVLDEHSKTAIPLSGGLPMELRVQVADEDADCANAVLRSIRESAPPPESEPEKFVSSAQPFLNVFDWVEMIITIIVVVAVLYRFFSS